MAEIHLQCDDSKPFSAFSCTRQLLDRATDRADSDGQLDIRLEGFSRRQAESILHLLSYLYSAHSNHKTAFAEPTTHEDYDAFKERRGHIETEPNRWDGELQEMHMRFYAPSLPVFAMKTTLNKLHQLLFAPRQSVPHTHASDSGYTDIICGNQQTAEFLSSSIVAPMLDAHYIPCEPGREIDVRSIPGSTAARLEIDTELFERLKAREVDSRGRML